MLIMGALNGFIFVALSVLMVLVIIYLIKKNTSEELKRLIIVRHLIYFVIFMSQLILSSVIT